MSAGAWFAVSLLLFAVLPFIGTSWTAWNMVAAAVIAVALNEWRTGRRQGGGSC